MRAPESWYWVKWDCELHRSSQSNMIRPPFHRETCKRKPRRKVIYEDNLRCHWSCCPKYKKQRSNHAKETN